MNDLLSKDPPSLPGAAVQAPAGDGYRVLARKYRPTTFDRLIGQDAVVRTLTNAITSGRIAQGYMLTGVRGVGKTTTARLIARALDCIGVDGKGGPTPSPCGVCSQCKAIADDRHVDVLEMDAASRTGIDDIRELLDGVRYRPTSARYKIYIIDEIHMLSEKAFNALLKTLEEPPEHVKFIFATTEIRKVPVTVLSRCQRFDLRRIGIAELTGLFADVARQESATVEPAAMSLIARAADGSARDGLSLLDQAISQASTGAAAKVTEAAVRDMLGLADRARVFDLLDAVMRGDVKAALTLLGDQYAAGASPIIVMQDLLELVHWLTKVKVAPDAANDPGLAETERTRGADMAKQLGVPALTRAWNILLKGLGEARSAPIPLQAVEMMLIRLAYAADLPTPSDALKQLEGAMASARASAPASSPRASLSAVSGSAAPAAEAQPARAQPVAVGSPAAMAAPQSFVGVVELFEERRQLTIAAHMRRGVRLVRFEDGRIDIGLEKGAPADLPGQIGKLLTEWTSRRWLVSIANAAGDKTLHEQALDRAKSDPLVKTILDTFPDAVIQNIRRAEAS